MTDYEKLFKIIHDLQLEIRKEFQDRRKHVDAEIRRLHEKIDDNERKLREDMQPFILNNWGRRMVWNALVGIIVIMGTITAAVVAVVELFSGGTK